MAEAEEGRLFNEPVASYGLMTPLADLSTGNRIKPAAIELDAAGDYLSYLP